MDWNEITATVESHLAEREEVLAGEERELAQRRATLRKRRGALRARRKAFEQCREIWASIDRRLESDGAGGDADPAEDAGLAAEPGLKLLSAGGDG